MDVACGNIRAGLPEPPPVRLGEDTVTVVTRRTNAASALVAATYTGRGLTRLSCEPAPRAPRPPGATTDPPADRLEGAIPWATAKAGLRGCLDAARQLPTWTDGNPRVPRAP